jgi:kynurenine formamidase
VRRLRLETREGTWKADLERGRDLSIPLAFDGAQPNLFDAPAAGSLALRGADFIGDVALGGSVNCSEYRLTPHCNGTHTECVGHVTRQRVSIREVSLGGIEPALLLSIAPVAARRCGEDSDPLPLDDDLVITASAIEAAWKRWRPTPFTALVLRTLPNDTTKLARRYEADAVPPYLTRQAAELVVDRGIEHLLLDVPSLDRTHDDGKLTGHRIFWGLPAGSTDVTAATRPAATVTELIYVPNELQDGWYLLDLQVAPFEADAAPSRPFLFPVIP